MKYFIDTEFIEDQNKLKLISIGIVAQNGQSYYAVSSEFTDEECNDWVKKNVLPFLSAGMANQTRKPISQIKEELLKFIVNNDMDRPQFYGYYCDYDWVLFRWIFGKMIDLPKGYPMYCRDVKQMLDHYNLKKQDLKIQSVGNSTPHNAIFDAYEIKDMYDAVKKQIL